jgi:hypothetical protein
MRFLKTEFSFPKIEFGGASRSWTYIVSDKLSDLGIQVLPRETAGDVREVGAALDVGCLRRD